MLGISLCTLPVTVALTDSYKPSLADILSMSMLHAFSSLSSPTERSN